MATIRRHAVPADSYEPNRPLNDLGRDQLKHFIHVAQQLPPGFRFEDEPPSAEDGPACTLYIAAVTEHLMAARRSGLTLLPKRPRKQTARVVDLAAAAATKGRKTTNKKTTQSKSSQAKAPAAKPSIGKIARAKSSKTKAAASKSSKRKVARPKSRKAGGDKP